MVDVESEEIIKEIKNYWFERKFEAHPFKIKWYNDAVQPIFKLQYDDDTLAFVVLSVPGMFNEIFLPFIKQMELKQSELIKDPLDNCMKYEFNKFREVFNGHEIDVFHDFQLNIHRRAKILMQTAGHVSGAAFFYQRKDVEDDLWGDRKIYGVSLHPLYGGWFGFRAVIVLKDVIYANLRQKQALDLLGFREKKIELLEKFNFQWRDSTYRDVIAVNECYTCEEKLYFDTLPKDRFKLIEKWRKI